MFFQATEGPLHIARDCLANRQRRIDYDLVQDIAEKELLKEIELIAQVQVGINPSKTRIFVAKSIFK